MILAARLSVACGKVWSGVVSTLVIVVLDVEVDQLAEVYPQSAAGVVDVLSIQRLEEDKGEATKKVSAIVAHRKILNRSDSLQVLQLKDFEILLHVKHNIQPFLQSSRKYFPLEKSSADKGIRK